MIPATAEMTTQIQALGYVKGESIGCHTILPSGQQVAGHEFHYSRLEPARDARYALRLSRGKGIDAGNDGTICQNVLGCYTHTYFTSSFAHAMVDAAAKFSQR